MQAELTKTLEPGQQSKNKNESSQYGETIKCPSKHHTLNFHEVRSRIHNCDLSILSSRIALQLQMTPAEANIAINEYKKFLEIKIALDGEHGSRSSAPLIIDKIWSMHILATRSYETDCLNMCGFVIHHDHDDHHDPKQQISTRKERLQRTITAYRTFYSITPNPTYWTLDDDVPTIFSGTNVSVSNGSTTAATISPSAATIPVQRVSISKPATVVDTLKITIKDWTGREFALDVKPSETVSNIKKMIFAIDGSPPQVQQLMYNGSTLDDRVTLSHCAIKTDSIIFMVHR